MTDDIRRLIDGTEANIKRFETLTGEFPCNVLNEWRYATRHVVSLLDSPDDGELRMKVVGHLRRAFFDSCEVLIVSILDRWDGWTTPFQAWPGMLNAAVPDWERRSELMRRARRAHRDRMAFTPEQKEERAVALGEMIDPLIDALDAVEDAMPALRKARWKAIARDAVAFVAAIGTVAGVVAKVVGWLF